MGKNLCIINTIGKDLFVDCFVVLQVVRFGKDVCVEDFHHW